MLFTTLLRLGALTLAAAQTKLQFTSTPGPATIGQTSLISWTGGSGDPITLTLREGSPSNLSTVAIIATNVQGNNYNWTVPSSIPPADDYALQITQGLDTINYSGEFSVVADNANQTTTLYAVAGGSSYPVATITPTALANSSSNATMTMTGGAASSSGTGTALPRNTTMSMATLSSSATLTTTQTTTTASSTGGALAKATAQAFIGLGAVAAAAVYLL